MAKKIMNLIGPVGSIGANGATGPAGGPGPRVFSSDSANALVAGTDQLAFLPLGNIPLASPTQNGLVRQLSGSGGDFIDGTNNSQNLIAAEEPVIWSVRQRSFNAAANPSFEVYQRPPLPGGSTGGFVTDRWIWVAPLATGRAFANYGLPSVKDPNTGFPVSSQSFNIYCTTVQASLAAGEYAMIYQFVEGPAVRELLSGFSVTILFPQSYAYPFSFFIRNAAYTWSYTKLINPANYPLGTTYNVTIPNLSLYSGTSWPTTPGVQGLNFGFCLASGTTYIAPADGVWSSGNFLASPGQSNFFSSATNYFGPGFVQIEPGPVCGYLLDCPFLDNLRSCKRYYQKSWMYGVYIVPNPEYREIGTYIAVGPPGIARSNIEYPVEMAFAPTVTIYDYTGNSGRAYLDSGGTTYPCSPSGISTKGVAQLNFSTSTTNATWYPVLGQWMADTSW